MNKMHTDKERRNFDYIHKFIHYCMPMIMYSNNFIIILSLFTLILIVFYL